MAGVFKKQTRSTLTQLAQESIRQAIEEGRLRPGQRIIEAKLSEEMQISRFPIREALRYLEKEGLVVTEPFKGVRVAEITLKDVHELLTLRSALEELAARLTAQAMDEGMRAELEERFQALEKAAGDGDEEALVAADTAFHQAICRLSGHGRLLDSWTGLETQIRTFIHLERPHWRDDDFVATHRPILDALVAGDAPRAELAVREHIVLITNIIRDFYDPEGDEQ